MNGADEDDTQSDPQNRGKPAELLARQNWSGDRTRRRDRGKVLAQQVKLPGRHKIDSVIDGIGWSGIRGIQTHDAGDDPSVQDVSHGQHRQNNRGKKCDAHQSLRSSPRRREGFLVLRKLLRHQDAKNFYFYLSTTVLILSTSPRFPGFSSRALA